MYITWLRLALIIASAIVAGLNIFHIMNAKAMGISLTQPVLTFIAMLLLIGAILVTQYVNNRK